MAKISFHLKDTKADRPTAVFILLTADGKRTKIYSGYSIHPGQWNSEDQQAKTRGYPAANGELNRGLKRMGEKLQTYYAEQRADGVIPSAEALKAVVEPEEEVVAKAAGPTFFDLFEQWIASSALTKSPNTIRTYRTTLRHLQAFEKATRYKLSFAALNADFADKFTAYLIETAGLNDSVIRKNGAILKNFLGFATDRGLNTNLAFKKFSWKHREPDVIALTRDEVRAIESLELPMGHYLDNARGLFLLSCYTGLRFSDVAALRREHDKGDRLKVTTQKTRDTLIIPVTPKSRVLLNRLWAGELHPITNQKLNEFVKEVTQRAGVDAATEHISYRGGQRHSQSLPKYELISSHTGRRTFVTLALESGLPWEVIMKATGHKDMKSFRRYIQVTEERQIKAFANFLCD